LGLQHGAGGQIFQFWAVLLVGRRARARGSGAPPRQSWGGVAWCCCASPRA